MWTHGGLLAYFGPGSQATQEELDSAKKVADELLETKEFELEKDSILRICYREPNAFSGGSVQFETSNQKIKVNVDIIRGSSELPTLNTLVSCLSAFAPDRFYDDRKHVLMSQKKR